MLSGNSTLDVFEYYAVHICKLLFVTLVFYKFVVIVHSSGVNLRKCKDLPPSHGARVGRHCAHPNGQSWPMTGGRVKGTFLVRPALKNSENNHLDSYIFTSCIYVSIISRGYRLL